MRKAMSMSPRLQILISQVQRILQAKTDDVDEFRIQPKAFSASSYRCHLLISFRSPLLGNMPPLGLMFLCNSQLAPQISLPWCDIADHVHSGVVMTAVQLLQCDSKTAGRKTQKHASLNGIAPAPIQCLSWTVDTSNCVWADNSEMSSPTQRPHLRAACSAAT